MRDFSEIRMLPNKSGVYCLLGSSVRSPYPAYVGIGTNLRNRVSQHLEYRNSSVTTGASAVSLDASQVGGCQWWTDPVLEDAIRLHAFELVAFDHLNPTLRSRGGIRSEARKLSKEGEFRTWAIELLENPSGTVHFPGISELTKTVQALTERVMELERSLQK
ncbi:hypothetical protein GCM10011517_26540 [Actibacterium pelagium]|uniref:GIY-YIG domain-containing protein n=1 Tax=Actibacterium pelagium TaxID=2029103 RepID=A0A917AJH2_9RHOB|nr:hypothetical protein GCM10011517_26540 [Actibacterium pelagium]